MNLNYQFLIPEDFAPSSKVWIYQCNRLLGLAEALQAEQMINEFVANWESHGVPVKGFGIILFGQFVVLIADETATGVSGCSTDSSVRLIKQLEQVLKINLFDRELLAFVIKDKIQVLPLSQLKYAAENGFINGDTIYFNNLVNTKEQLINQWLVPVKESWLRNRIAINV